MSFDLVSALCTFFDSSDLFSTAGWPGLWCSFNSRGWPVQASLGRGFPEARLTRPERHQGRTLFPVAAGANMAEAYVVGRCQGQDGREHNPGHELNQQYASDHLRTALRPAMNMTTVIPAVINIQTATTRLPATAI